MTEVVVRVVHLKQTVMAVRDSRSSGQALPGSDFHKSGIFTGENPPHQHVTKFAPRPHHVMSSVAQLFSSFLVANFTIFLAWYLPVVTHIPCGYTSYLLFCSIPRFSRVCFPPM